MGGPFPAHLPGMSTQTRQPAGAPIGGQFTTHPQAEAGLTLPAPNTRLIHELANLGFNIANSAAAQHAIATDTTQPVETRRAAVRTALETATNDVLRTRWNLSDNGDPVTDQALKYAATDEFIDAGMARYAEAEYEDGDEHLFGVDMAAALFQEGQDRTVNYWAKQHATAPTPATVRARRDDLDAYETGSLKRAAAAQILDDLDAA